MWPSFPPKDTHSYLLYHTPTHTLPIWPYTVALSEFAISSYLGLGQALGPV